MNNNTTIKKQFTLIFFYLSICGVYLPFVKGFAGIYLLFVSLVLIAFNGVDKLLIKCIPAFLLWGVTAIMLHFSGRWGEHDFNSPYMNYSKYVYFLFVVVMALTIKLLDNQDKRKILIFAISSMTLTCILNIYYSMVHGGLSIREALGENDASISSWDQMVCMSIFIMIVFGYYIYNKLFFKPIWICLLLIISYFLYIASLATPLVVGVVGCLFFTIYMIYNKDRKKAIKYICWFGVIYILMRIFAKPISEFLLNLLNPDNEMLYGRLTNVIDSIFGTTHNTEYSFDRREELAMFSLSSFYKHPLFGIGYSSYRYGTIGGHYEWYDMLGVFGACGSFVILLICFYYIKTIFKESNTELDKICFISAIVQFVLLGFHDPCFSATVMICVFVIAPNISSLSKDYLEE